MFAKSEALLYSARADSTWQLVALVRMLPEWGGPAARIARNAHKEKGLEMNSSPLMLWIATEAFASSQRSRSFDFVPTALRSEPALKPVEG